MRRFAFSAAALGVVFGLTWLAGCSGSKKRFVAKGVVLYQGRPLSSGRLWLYMSDQRAALADIGSDGTFTITDVFSGKARVAVAAGGGPSARMRQLMAAPAGEGAPAAGPRAQLAGEPLHLPDKYKDANTSGVVVSVVPGEALVINLD